MPSMLILNSLNSRSSQSEVVSLIILLTSCELPSLWTDKPDSRTQKTWELPANSIKVYNDVKISAEVLPLNCWQSSTYLGQNYSVPFRGTRCQTLHWIHIKEGQKIPAQYLWSYARWFESRGVDSNIEMPDSAVGNIRMASSLPYLPKAPNIIISFLLILFNVLSPHTSLLQHLIHFAPRWWFRTSSVLYKAFGSEVQWSEVAAGDFKMYIDDDAGLLSLSHHLWAWCIFAQDYTLHFFPSEMSKTQRYNCIWKCMINSQMGF